MNKQFGYNAKNRVPTVEDTAYMAYIILDFPYEDMVEDADIIVNEPIQKKVDELRAARENPLDKVILKIKNKVDKKPAESNDESVSDGTSVMLMIKNNQLKKDIESFVAMGVFYFKAGDNEINEENCNEFSDLAGMCFPTGSAPESP